MSVGVSCGFFNPFRPFLFDVIVAPGVTTQPSPFCPQGVLCFQERLQAFEQLLDQHSPKLAGVVIEPLIQGVSGMHMQPVEWLREVTLRTQRRGIPVIFDEVFTGFGRTGAMYAFQKAGLEPDLVCLAKMLTGGTLPLAATLTKESFFEAFLGTSKKAALLHGHSYTALPTACAVALASLDLLEKEHLLQKAQAREQDYRTWLASVGGPLGIGQGRALGNVLAFELPGTGLAHYFHATGGKVQTWGRAHGLMLRPLGNTVYVCPPLTLSPEEVQFMLSGLESVCRASLR
jgi:adenosylmethionine-8-amino-7-oxononanoate aminotransferase